MSKWKFTSDHAKGMAIGIITPIIFIPVVLFFIAWAQDYYFEVLWHKFSLNTQFRIKILTISIIANLIWFYFFLNRERFNMARGVILGSFAFAPYVLYIKFF